MYQISELAQEIYPKVEGILLQGIQSAVALHELGIKFVPSSDQFLNDKVSVNQISILRDIHRCLYKDGFGALSIVAERRNDVIDRRLIKQTVTYQAKLAQIQIEIQETTVGFETLDNDWKDAFLNGLGTEDEAIRKTLEDPDPNDKMACGIVEEIKKRMLNSAMFVCRVTNVMAQNHLEFEIHGAHERKLTRIPKGRIDAALIPDVKNNSQNANEDSAFNVPIYFVPMKRGRVNLRLSGDFFESVALILPDYESKVETLLMKRGIGDIIENNPYFLHLLHIVRFESDKKKEEENS